MSDRVCQDDCEAYRLFGTPNELELEAMQFDAQFMSPGLTAWRAIAFALERGEDLSLWVRQYLEQSAKGIENWAMLNGHPSELKDILALHGKRKHDNDQNDPRWIYDAISQMRERDPGASITSLVDECMRRFPRVGTEAGYVRQKYYEGKKLAETGQDYKGRGRKKDMQTAPMIDDECDGSDIDF